MRIRTLWFCIFACSGCGELPKGYSDSPSVVEGDDDSGSALPPVGYCAHLPPNETGAIVFTYSSDSPKEFPQDTIERLCDPNPGSAESFFYVPVWERAQAGIYGVEFEMDLTCFPEPIQIPAELFNVAGSMFPISSRILADYLREHYPVLNDYAFIAVNHFFPSNPDYDTENYAGGGTEGGTRSFFLSTIEYDTGIHPPTRRTFAHEFAHLQGATDKYGTTAERACLIDPETGEEFDGHDIMCHRAPRDLDSGYDMPPLEELIVSEPTAREICWLPAVE